MKSTTATPIVEVGERALFRLDAHGVEVGGVARGERSGVVGARWVRWIVRFADRERPDACHGCDAVGPADLIEQFTRDRARVGAHDEVGRREFVHLLDGGLLEARAGDRHERHEEQADHQRIDGGRRAFRIASDVVGREPRRHAQVPEYPARTGGERSGERRSGEQYADEEQRSTERQRKTVLGEHECDAADHEDCSDDHARDVTLDAIRRLRRASLPTGAVRTGPERRHERRQRGDEGAGEQPDDHHGRREHDARLGKIEGRARRGRVRAGTSALHRARSR